MGVKKRCYKEAKSLLSLIERWRERGELTTLERDMALSKLSAIYESILLSTSEPDEEDYEDEVVEQKPIEAQESVVEAISSLLNQEIEAEVEAEAEAEPEVEVEVVLYDEDNQEVETFKESESQGEDEPEIEVEMILYDQEEEQEEDQPESEPTPEPEPEPEPEPTTGFEAKPRSARRAAILSLYDDDEDNEEVNTVVQDVTPELEPEPESLVEEIIEEQIEEQVEEKIEEIAEEQTEESVKKDSFSPEIKNIAERLSENIERLSDKLQSDNSQTFVADKIASLTGGLSLNDKYEIANELFSGDVEKFVSLLEELDKLSSFDECVIYISENYNFSSNTPTVDMFLNLLERRFA
ncbi:MAG: hypothetical protein SNJ33_07005 [Rikenellaceae bacterium]